MDQIDPIVWRSLAQIYLNGKRRKEARRLAELAAAGEPQQPDIDNLNSPQA